MVYWGVSELVGLHDRNLPAETVGVSPMISMARASSPTVTVMDGPLEVLGDDTVIRSETVTADSEWQKSVD